MGTGALGWFLIKKLCAFLCKLNRKIIFLIFSKNIKQVLNLPAEKCKPKETALFFDYLN